MIRETGIKCVVSGSFSKFKPEIDRTIEEFRDLGIEVLAPQKGWLYIPPSKIVTPKDLKFRPLPSETHMSIREIEDGFLENLAIAHFQYVENQNGYVGESVCFEIGFALAYRKPIFARFPLSPTLDLDPVWKLRISSIHVLSPAQVIDKIRLFTQGRAL